MTDQTPIARVVAVTGDVYVRNENGEMRLLEPDSVIYPGDRIVADPGEFVELAMANGQSMLVDSQTPVTFSDDMLPETAENSADAALADGSIDELLKALENGEEVDALLEAPAAGAGGDDGHSFVVLERIVETLAQQAGQGEQPEFISAAIDVLDAAGGQNNEAVTTPQSAGPSNSNPVAGDDTITVGEDSVFSSSVNLTANDFDADGDSLTVVPGTFNTSQGGSIVIAADGSYTYTPPANYSGSDSVTYTVTDGALSDTGTLNITVAPATDLTAGDDSLNVTEDSGLTTGSVTANDSTTSGGSLSYAVASGVSNGTLAFRPDGSYDYTPNANFNGSDSFTYTVTDAASGESSTQTVNITVAPVNDAPTAINDSITVDEDSVFASTIDLDANDTDPDGDALSVVAGTFTTAQGGSIVIAADGSYTYTPKVNFSGSDSVDYTVTDGVLTDTGTLNITVAPVADAPVISQPTATPPTSTGLKFSFYDELNNSDRNASSQEGATNGASPTTETRQMMGFGTDKKVVNTSVIQTDGSTIEIEQGDTYAVMGLIYLQAGSTYQFSGYQDDSIRIELGGQTLISSTGDSYGNYGQGTSKFNDSDNVFTAPEDGYYTLEVYVNNVTGPGQFSLNVNVDGGPAKALNATNFSIYSDATDLAAVGGQFSNFVESGSNTGGGYFPASLNTGLADSMISIDNLNVALTDTDGSEVIQSIVIKGIPVGATLVSGANSFIATAGNTQVDVTSWTLSELYISPPSGFVGTFDLGVTAVSLETANSDTAVSNQLITVNVIDFNTATAGLDADLLGDGNIIQGSSGDDDLSTTAANRIIDGDAGNDIISGRSGSDVLVGGLGDDDIKGKGGDDFLYGEAGQDDLDGGAGKDFLAGGVGDDNLSGGSGDDMLLGGEGNDFLVGGAGVDTFAWELGDQGVAGAPAMDTIADFNNGSDHDVLDLRDLLVDEENHDLTDYLHVRESGGDTFIDVSSDGQFASGFDASKVDQTIELTGVDFGSIADQSALLQSLVDSGKLVTD